MHVVAKRGAAFTVFITKKSYETMKLALGDEVYLTFKASAVEVL